MSGNFILVAWWGPLKNVSVVKTVVNVDVFRQIMRKRHYKNGRCLVALRYKSYIRNYYCCC